MGPIYVRAKRASAEVNRGVEGYKADLISWGSAQNSQKKSFKGKKRPRASFYKERKFKDKKKFFKRDDSKKLSFKDKKKFFKRDDSRKPSFKNKKKFFKRDDSRKSSFKDKKKKFGFTNNPKYFDKKHSDD